VTRDPQKKYTDVILNETSPAVETFSDIISISKLRRQLGSKKAKAEFRNRYDLVFAEVNVMDMLPEILGWDFYKSGRKMPLPIQLVNPKTKLVDARLARYQARKLTKSTALAVVPGTCLSVVAGTTSMDAKELVENIEAAARGVVERAGQVPVAGVHIKTAESMSLPIWTS
jgi:ribosomal protein L1